jgi:hypothetical protein
MCPSPLAGVRLPPAGAGTGALLALIALIAVLVVIAGVQDGRARRAAWARIGAERRRLQQQRHALELRESAQEQHAWELDARERGLEAREHALLVTHDDS